MILHTKSFLQTQETPSDSMPLSDYVGNDYVGSGQLPPDPSHPADQFVYANTPALGGSSPVSVGSTPPTTSTPSTSGIGASTSTNTGSGSGSTTTSGGTGSGSGASALTSSPPAANPAATSTKTPSASVGLNINPYVLVGGLALVAIVGYQIFSNGK
jgi:cobalamin biosynthesis Mg chelatase CobN